MQGRRRKKRWADIVEEDLMNLELEILKCEEGDVDDYLFEAWDDVRSGDNLDIRRVPEARALEMNYIKSRKVYRYASKADAKRAGAKIIRTK